MDNLFRLYHYLSRSAQVNEDSAYTIAYDAVQGVLNLLIELDTYGQEVINHHYLDYQQREKLIEIILNGHKVALCNYADYSTVEAIADFAHTHLLSEDYTRLIKRLQAQQEARERKDS